MKNTKKSDRRNITEYVNRHCEKMRIRHKMSILAYEKMTFLNGIPLCDIDIHTESRNAVRMAFRIIEKRVCQTIKRRNKEISGGISRYRQRHWTAKYIQNFYGSYPVSQYLPRGSK